MSELLASFDYAFIGMGCANSLILMELHNRDMLTNKRIVIYEPAQKVANDRTFCFWLEPEKLKAFALDQLVTHSWSKVKINALDAQSLASKNYYYLRSDVLYTHTRNLLSNYDVTWKEQQIEGYPEQLGKIVFDSRPPLFEKQKIQDVQLKQSFYGWLVQTDAPIFDPDVFTMMDFSVAQNKQTQFLYVLPFASNKALIEPTRFGKDLISEKDATALIENFLTEKNTTFQILEREQGCIPMCSSSLERNFQAHHWIRTGANGGQLKPSTGYSFVRNLEDSALIVKSIQQQSQIKRRISTKRFQYYDRLLLHILARYPSEGKRIFSQLFKKNQANKVLEFLDEKSTASGELRIMKSLPILLFLRAAFLDLTLQIKGFFMQRSWLFLFCLLFVILGELQLTFVNNIILFIGMLAFGIPHGALDHLHQNPNAHLWNPKFLLKYLSLGLFMLLIWIATPVLGLVLFISYTAWHFGQADFQHWQIRSPIGAFLWGLALLALMLFGHWQETIEILAFMQVSLPKLGTGYFQMSAWFELLFISGVWIIGLVMKINKSILESVLVLLLAFQLPLISAFGLYFIFQHSWHGWTFLERTLKMNFLQLWKKGALFTIGAILFFILFLFTSSAHQLNWGTFFIFLSALSFPHVIYMHLLYKRHS